MKIPDGEVEGYLDGIDVVGEFDGEEDGTFTEGDFDGIEVVGDFEGDVDGTLVDGDKEGDAENKENFI